MVYKWKDASQIKVDAQTAGEICEKLERNGGLTAKRLVDESRSKTAPLHDAFEWDDEKAAEAYREDQARYIIRSLIIESETKEGEPVRAFFSIYKNKSYERVDVILEDSRKSEALIEMALKELKAFRAKYSHLAKLIPVFQAIDEVS